MSMIAPDVQVLLNKLAQQPTISFSDLSTTEARMLVKQMAELLDAPADIAVNAIDYECPGIDGRKIPVRCYSKVPQNDGLPIILFIHGGGWVCGDIESYDSFCRFMAAQTLFRVVSVEYRLAPESQFPAALDDVILVARWLNDIDSPCKCDEGLIIAGDSAGGGLAAAAVQILQTEGFPLRAQLLFYPVLDTSRQSESYTENANGYLLKAADMEHFIDLYIGDAAQKLDPRCSPLLCKSKKGLPPLVMLTCSLDVLRDEGRSYAIECIKSGVTVHYIEATGYIHGLVTLRAAIPSCVSILEQALECLISIVNKQEI